MVDDLFSIYFTSFFLLFSLFLILISFFIYHMLLLDSFVANCFGQSTNFYFQLRFQGLTTSKRKKKQQLLLSKRGTFYNEEMQHLMQNIQCKLYLFPKGQTITNLYRSGHVLKGVIFPFEHLPLILQSCPRKPGMHMQRYPLSVKPV